VNVHEAKAHLSRLLEAVEVGRTSSSLEPANRSPGWCRPPRGRSRGRPGRGGDKVVIADDFDETPEDLIAACHGDTGP
jgi:hypothetical protein